MKLRGVWTLLIALTSLPALAQTEKDQEVQKLVDDLCTEVEAYTGLKFAKKVPAALQSREEFGKYVKEQFDKDMPPEKAHGTKCLFQQLGWVGEDYDFATAMADLFTSQAAAYYEPEKDHIYMLMGKPEDKMFKITVFHELVHALQDQYADLGKLMKDADKVNDDASTAFRFLPEGEATFWMTLYAMGQKDFSALPPAGKIAFTMGRGMTSKQLLAGARAQAKMSPDMEQAAKALEKAPPILIRGLTDPYQRGQYLIMKVYEKGGMDACRKLFANPPTCTRDALFPDEWLEAPRKPVEIPVGDLAATLGSGWKKVYDNVAGALTWHVLFENYRRESDTIAKNWDGDRTQVWENGKDKLIVAVINFETKGTADLFAKQLERVYRETWTKGKDIVEVSKEPMHIGADTDHLVIALDGATVTFMRGAIPAHAEKLLEAAKAAAAVHAPDK